MTSRFDRLSLIDRAILMVMIASVSTFLFPGHTFAQTSNQKQIVFEIKIPNPTEIAALLNAKNKPATPAPEAATQVAAAPAPQTSVAVASKTSYKIPPKTVGDARVYMHEPEIRAYVCPKLGDRCNTFIAILKGENGTHECTRDNRGTNRNGSIDIGLAQINWSPKSPYTFEQLQDCKFNLDVALSMVARRGFQPWYAYTKGTYKKHLPAVLATAKALAEAAQTAEAIAPAAEPKNLMQ